MELLELVELMRLLEHLELMEHLKLISLNNSIKTFMTIIKLFFSKSEQIVINAFYAFWSLVFCQLRHDFSLYFFAY